MDDFKVAETHVSRLIFTGDHVYKVKKPVAFGFLDLRNAKAREVACHAEVILNRRLAPDIYDGVGVFVSPDGTPEPVVVMKRLPENRSLSDLIRVRDGELDRHVADLAAKLAEFHRQAQRSPQIDAACQPAALLGVWRDGLAELRTVSAGIIDAAALDEVMSEVERYIEGRVAVFEERIAKRRCVDGHGDLLCDDIFCLAEGARILDCLEFSAKLRYLDTLSDVASLAMDLEDHGRSDLAAHFLSNYRKDSGDNWPASLASLYIAYRATVRCKVACLRATLSEESSRQRYVSAAQDLFALARRHLESARVRLVLIGGLPGTGKSTLAEQIRAETGWVVLSSDVLRKRLAGLDPSDDASAAFGTGLYAPEATATVYSELLEEAGILLRRGVSVVIDASWMRQSWRDAAADLAVKTSAQLVSIHCEAPVDLTHRRLNERDDRRGSDANVTIADSMAAAVEPWIEAIAVNTSAGIAESTVVALEVIGVPRQRRAADDVLRPDGSFAR